MVDIVLYNPQIPPNTGNIMRLCSNTGFTLHLIEPLGFKLDEKSLKRAKLDYFSNIDPIIHKSFDDCFKVLDINNIYIISKYGYRNYDKAQFNTKSVILFGSESKGLPDLILSKYKGNTYKIPMIKNSRSLNLSNAVAVIAYEAWKQLKFSSIS
tara:strand:- start:528 stop:989 length:462 start_codon:yes stop_codon:yes gene_type:complete